MRGKLVVRFGPMWSDKTNWLIKKIKELNRGAVGFKPRIDNRYTKKAVLRSHDGLEVKAMLIDNKKPQELIKYVKKHPRTKRIVLDETNFFDNRLVKVVEKLLDMGVDVYAAGLMYDADRKEFGATKKLTVIANEMVIGRARCDYRYANGICTIPARHSYTKQKKETQLVVGTADLYGAACSDHYHQLHVTSDKNGEWWKRLRLPKRIKIDPEMMGYLKSIKLPYLRRPLKYDENRIPRIEVGADTLRVGKSTAVKVIGQELKKSGLEVKTNFEDWKNNPHLKKSYQDSSLALLNSQKWFIKRKYQQLNKRVKRKIWIQDVHPEMDFCYALTNAILGKMRLRHFQEYVEYFYSFDWGQIPAADVLLYLTAGDKVVKERAKKSLREFETVDMDYFLVMKRVNQAWLAGTKYVLDVVVMPINTDNFDFSKKKKYKKALTDKVKDRLSDLGWKL